MKLSDTQLVLLNGAAQRDDGSIEPLPISLKGGAVDKVIGALQKRGLHEITLDHVAVGREAAWSRAREGRRSFEGSANPRRARPVVDDTASHGASALH